MTLELEALGFTGFYQGIWDQSENEWAAICEMKYGQCEDFEDLQFIDEWGFCEDYRDHIGAIYAKAFVELINETLGTDFKLLGQTVRSPREYNFRTDEIYCTVEIGDRDKLVKKLVALANSESIIRDAVSQAIRTNHTSCDGFMSFMNNNFDKWCDTFLADGKDAYLSCFISYLTNALDPGCLSKLNESVYFYVDESTIYHMVGPQSYDARAEWTVYKEYGSDYTDWTREHPIRYENPEPCGPNYTVHDWDDYMEMFLEHMLALDEERKRKADFDSLPSIPGIE